MSCQNVSNLLKIKASAEFLPSSISHDRKRCHDRRVSAEFFACAIPLTRQFPRAIQSRLGTAERWQASFGMMICRKPEPIDLTDTYALNGVE